MESPLAAIFITAILNFVTAQAPYGYYQPVLNRRGMFVNDPRLRVGALDQFKSKFWKQPNVGYYPRNIQYSQQMQILPRNSYHGVDNGVKHFRQRYRINNGKSGVGASSRLKALDQWNPKLATGHRFSHKHFEYNPRIIQQASNLNSRGEEIGINKNKFLLQRTRGDDKDVIIYDQKNSRDANDDSKYVYHQKQISIDGTNTPVVSVDPNKQPVSGYKNHGSNKEFRRYWPSLPWNHDEENGHISSSSYYMRQSKRTHPFSPDQIRSYENIPNVQQEDQSQRSMDITLLTPEEGANFETIGHNIETPKYIQKQRIEKVDYEQPTVRNVHLPADVEDINTKISEDSARAILEMFKEQEKHNLIRHNLKQNVVDKNEEILMKFIIKNFTPDEVKHLIPNANTLEDKDKVNVAFKNYKLITHALIDFLKYSNSLTGLIQNVKIISEYKEPGSDIVTSSLEEVFAEDEPENNLPIKKVPDENLKPLSFPDKVGKNLNNLEDVAIPALYEDSGDKNIANNVRFNVIHNRRKLEVQKPEKHESFERTPKYGKDYCDEDADCDDNIEIVPEVWRAQNIDSVPDVHSPEDNEKTDSVSEVWRVKDIDRVPDAPGPENDENIIEITEVLRPKNINTVPEAPGLEDNENINGLLQIPRPRNKESTDVLPEVLRPEKNENIVPEFWQPDDNGNMKEVSSDRKLIMNEWNVEDSIKNESPVNTLGYGGSTTQDDSGPNKIETITSKKVNNDNKTDLELFMQNLQIHKKIDDKFCEKLNTEQAINVMENILRNFIEDLSNIFDNDVILKTAEYSVNRNLNVEMDNEDCNYY